MNRLVLLVVLAGAAVLAPATAAVAGSATAAAWSAGGAPIAQAASPAAVVRQRRLSLDQAVELVQRRYEARVVRAETREERGVTVYRIRLLSEDGRVFNVRVNAETGEIE